MDSLDRTILLLAAIFSLAITTCRAQEKFKTDPCSSNFEIQYDKVTRADKQSNVVEKSDGKSFIINFMSEFRDSVEVYINDKLEFADFVESDKMTGESGTVIGFRPATKGYDKTIIQIRSLTRNICCAVKPNRKYKFIYVFIDRAGHWIIRFSNVHYIH